MIKPKLPDKPYPSSEAGYTILEGIMAIVVVTVLLVAISPMIGFAAAVRMQAKRTQLASQAARSYISFAKSLSIDDDGEVEEGKNAPGTTYSISFEGTKATDLAAVAAPGNNLDCDDLVGGNENGYCSNDKELYCVNFDEEPGCQNTSPVDMVVQPLARFRGDVNDEGIVDAGTIDYKRGYELAVRVYQASSFRNDVTLKAKDDNGNTEATSFIGRRDLPLIQITTSVPPEKDNLYSTFCDDLGGCD
ncbi:MAG: hormogonium polysaccharide secretion pseudopilin HpsB [Microcoleaceae cyanobacterium]